MSSSAATTTTTTTTSNTGLKLLRFFIFKSSLGPKEGHEYKKIIFYHPLNDDIDTQCKYVGLAEAAVRFGAAFGSGPARSLHTQRTRNFFHEPESGFVMAMTVSVPFNTVRKSSGAEYIEFIPDDVLDDIQLSLLRRSYEMFGFFSGPFEKGEDEENMKGRARHFFSRYVPTIRPSAADIHSSLPAVQFLTLETSTFLRVLTFTKRLEEYFERNPPSMSHAVFFHRGNVIWSGLQQRETALLYHYLNTSLLPFHKDDDDDGDEEDGDDGDVNGYHLLKHKGRFFAGSLNKDITLSRIPKIKIKTKERLTEYHLIVYNALDTTVCLTIPSSVELTMDFLKRIDSFVGPSLTSLSEDLMDKLESEIDNDSSSGGVRFIYYNDYNRALKSTLVDARPAIIQIITELSQDLKKAEKLSKASFSTTTEISVKLNSDEWIVGRTADHRQVYVVVLNKNANLIDISAEVQKLVSAEFKNVCLLDK